MKRPLFAKKNVIAVKLASAACALTAAASLAKDERTACEYSKRWVSDASGWLKEIKERVSKSKFKGYEVDEKGLTP